MYYLLSFIALTCIAEGTNVLLYLVLLVDADRSLLSEGSKLNLWLNGCDISSHILLPFCTSLLLYNRSNESKGVLGLMILLAKENTLFSIYFGITPVMHCKTQKFYRP